MIRIQTARTLKKKGRPKIFVNRGREKGLVVQRRGILIKRARSTISSWRLRNLIRARLKMKENGGSQG